MVDQVCRSERTTRIAGRGLDEEAFERRLEHDAAVHHRVERDAARQTEILFTGFFVQTVQQVKHRVFEHSLRACRDVLMTAGYFLVFLPSRTELSRDLFAELIALGQMVIQHVDVDVKIVAAVQREHSPRQEIAVDRPAVSRETHHLPFVSAEHVEPEKVGDRRVKLAKRMRQLDSLERPDSRPLAARPHRRSLFAGSIHRQNGRCLEWRYIERAGGVAEMMLLVVEFEPARAESLTNQARKLQHSEIAAADLGHSAINPGHEHIARNAERFNRLHGFVPEHPWLPVERYVLYIGHRYARFAQAVFDRFVGKAAVVLYS